MKQRITPIDDSARFRGKVRHHHRVGGQPLTSWEEWIAGEMADRPKRTWFWLHFLKILAVVLGVAILIAIGVGLYIEMS